MTLREANYYLLNKLRPVYPEGEASAIADLVMEKLTGSGKTERMLYKNASITNAEEVQLQEWLLRLLLHEPVQYVLQEAWFAGLKFYVDEHVLIPRPETEELVEWVEKDTGSHLAQADTVQHILDIGTGSGCIPIVLKKKLPAAMLTGCDVSESALRVAEKNAAGMGVSIQLLLLDFLDPEQRKRLPQFHQIVSNPPYIPLKDKISMPLNVVAHEPHLALFVPDNDPLLFYRAIADFGREHLVLGGAIYLETHEDLNGAVEELFQQSGYQTRQHTDMQGKKRMVRAIAN